MVAKTAQKVVGTLLPTRQGKGISKQKVMSYIVLILAGAPSFIPHFSDFMTDKWRSGLMGAAAFLVIVFREAQRDL